jgi:hypothetical protein
MQALESLLFLIEKHLAHHKSSKVTQTYRDGEIKKGDEKPREVIPECDGRCLQCDRSECPPDEAWLEVYERIRKSYPVLKEIEEKLLPELAYKHGHWWYALYAQYIEPWKEWHAETIAHTPDGQPLSRREVEAQAGLLWLAQHVRGDIPFFGQPIWEVRKQHRELVITLHEEGLSYGEIERRTGLSKGYCHEICCGRKSRRRRTLSAQGAT